MGWAIAKTLLPGTYLGKGTGFWHTGNINIACILNPPICWHPKGRNKVAWKNGTAGITSLKAPLWEHNGPMGESQIVQHFTGKRESQGEETKQVIYKANFEVHHSNEPSLGMPVTCIPPPNHCQLLEPTVWDHPHRKSSTHFSSHQDEGT